MADEMYSFKQGLGCSNLNTREEVRNPAIRAPRDSSLPLPQIFVGLLNVLGVPVSTSDGETAHGYQADRNNLSTFLQLLLPVLRELLLLQQLLLFLLALRLLHLCCMCCMSSSCCKGILLFLWLLVLLQALSLPTPAPLRTQGLGL